jgi:noranthrone synthase
MLTPYQDKGQKTAEHAGCGIKFTDRSELARLQSQMSHVRRRVQELQKDLESGKSYRFNAKMAYLMVLGVAQFHEDYRCIDEVILNSGSLEAVGWIDLAKAKKGGSFTVHPAYVDAMTQLGGFVMNANDGADLDKEVFINHGWKSSQIYQELQPDKKYRNYVKMVAKEGNMYEGDVVIFDGDNVVAVFKGVEVCQPHLMVPSQLLMHGYSSKECRAECCTTSLLPRVVVRQSSRRLLPRGRPRTRHHSPLNQLR